MQKISRWWENALAAVCLIALMIFAPLTTFSLEPVRKPAPVAPAAPAVEAPLLLPLQCDAWIVQSGDGIATPRARCYHFKGRS